MTEVYLEKEQFQKANNLIAPFSTWGWGWDPARNAEFRVSYFHLSFVFRRSIMEYLRELCKLSGDSSFYWLMMNSEEIAYFNEDTEVYPGTLINANCNQNEYSAQINQKAPNVPLTLSDCGNTVSLFPESLNWHIYGQKQVEMARLAIRKTIPAPGDADSVPWILPGDDEMQENLAWLRAHPDIAP